MRTHYRPGTVAARDRTHAAQRAGARRGAPRLGIPPHHPVSRSKTCVSSLYWPPS
ncbi:hypothetical protein [Lysobacter gummosus]|uniref:hypothetical protein n=1 Tax=Lysobacter gummosus TaxID=262324 RepID=UPI0036285DEA